MLREGHRAADPVVLGPDDIPWKFPTDPEMLSLIEDFDRLQELVADVRLPWWKRLWLWLFPYG